MPPGAGRRSPPGAPDRILLIRHGESEQNAVTGRPGHAGYLDVQRRAPRSWGLTPLGERQAQACGRWLHATLTGPADLRCSPFRRTEATAWALGLGAPVLAEELAERSWGRWFDGASGEGYAARAGRARELAAADPWRWRPDGGESLLDVRARVGGYLWRSAAAGADPERSLLAVSHGEAILAARAYLEGIPLRRRLGTAPDGAAVHTLANAAVLVYSRLDPAGGREPGYRWRGVLPRPGDANAGWSGLSWVDLWAGDSGAATGEDDGRPAGDG